MTDVTPLRWGILATGGIANLMTKDLVAHGHLVTAVGSRTQQAAESFASAHGIAKSHGSYEELAADPDVDIVYVATPHSAHADNALLALQHGKHVLVEKAFTLNAVQAQTVIDEAARQGLVVMEAMWTRFLPHMRELRHLISEGRIGDVRAIHAEHCQSLRFGDQHRLRDPQLGGGALLDLGVYPVSFLHDIAGEPEEIHASAVMTSTEVDETIATVSVHADGVVATTLSSMDVKGSNEATILGTDGRIVVEGTFFAPTRLRLERPTGQEIDVFNSPVSGRGMQYQAKEMERVIRAHEPGSELMSPQASVQVMKTLDRIREQIGLRFPSE